MSDLELMQHQLNPSFAFCAADTSQSQPQTGVMRDRSSQEERLLEHGRDPPMIGQWTQLLPKQLSAHREST